ncbi:stalk domain-containing protein [Acetoanaerobium noterae]|uniref:stalk domain-containing protein n=1 Tax=Acetoanaerobium noterae TaxID=745369 RepID=UPI0028AD4FBE|nr:hypothetical protein [Acetoanaerobium noterae]
MMKKVFAIAICFMIGITSLTYATPKSIETYLQNDFLVKVDGEFKYHPEGLKPLVYENRTYLPASFIVELLGGSTTFDNSTKTVNIVSKPQSILDETRINEYETKIKELEEKIKKLENSTHVTSEYLKLPSRLSQNGYKITLEGLSIREEGTDGRLYFTLENEELDTGVKIDSMSTTIETDTEKYKASSRYQENFDPQLYKWVKRKQELKTFIPFSDLPENDKDIKEMTITVVLELNETNPRKETLVFKVIND